MKLLIGDKRNVDFNSSVAMTDDQKKKFIDFLKKMFAVVKVEQTDSIRTKRIGDKSFTRNWTNEEYAVLLELEDTNKVAEMLGRSWMSVDIKRGDFIPYFLAWTSRKGKDPLKDDVRELIKEFMKEKEQEILSKKERKKQTRMKLKEIERLKEELQHLNSDKKRGQIDLMIRLRQLKERSIEDFVGKKKKEILEKIARLEKETSDHDEDDE